MKTVKAGNELYVMMGGEKVKNFDRPRHPFISPNKTQEASKVSSPYKERQLDIVIASKNSTRLAGSVKTLYQGYANVSSNGVVERVFSGVPESTRRILISENSNKNFITTSYEEKSVSITDQALSDR